MGSLYREEYCQLLKKHMAEGRTFAEFAQRIAVSRSTLFHWLRARPDFAHARAEGKEAGDWWSKKRGDGSIAAVRADPTVAPRFWQMAARPSPKSCWLWRGSVVGHGYGKWRVHGRDWRAHRLALVLAGVDVPHRGVVCHHCDVPACVNPAHLYLGNDAANMADAHARGRFQRLFGEANRQAKLTWEQVSEMRRLYAQGDVQQKDLARRFGVSRSTTCQILKEELWPTVQQTTPPARCDP